MDQPWKTDDFFVSPWNYQPEVREAFSPPDRVAVHDLTLRDGEQQAGIEFTADQKMRIAEELAAAGVDRIEAGMPAVSPSDAEAVRRIASAGLPSRVFAFSRCMVSDVEKALETGVTGIIMEVPVSRHIIEFAYRWPYEKALEATIKSTRFAHENGLEIIFFPIDSTRAGISEFLDLIQTIEREGHMDGLVLVDTFGVLSPPAASFMVRKVKERISKPLETHFHNDFDLGVANTVAAVAQGVDTVQVSVSGIGERAGNVPLEETLLALKLLYGVESNVDLSKLYGLSKLVREIAGVPVPPNRSIVGDKIFHVESGIIVSWVKNSGTEHLTEAFPFRPELVGQTGPEIVLGKGSGLDSVLIWLDRLGLGPAEGDEASEILQEVKARSLANRALVDADEFREIAEAVISRRAKATDASAEAARRP
jgi:isopropylmalate/homocitrate/citramalate synthase